MINNYPSHHYINCIDAYKKPDDQEGWSDCPKCKFKPLIWIFDNGRHTACGCWNSKYDIFSISAESICSVLKRTGGSAVDYHQDDLKCAWNKYCSLEEKAKKESEDA